ncbi:MAG: TRAP transporter TatT component family protein [Pyrinomonadaceae bacterium]
MNHTLSTITERADALYAAREDLENVRESVKLLQSAQAHDDYEANWRLGRALFLLGQESKEATEAREAYARAIRFCQRAALAQTARVEGNFWLGVNLALLAQTENPLNALRHALQAKRALQRAVRLDPAYHAAGPLRVLARLEHKLPRLFGGSRARSRAHFEEAIRLSPSNTVTRIYFAELLLDSGDLALARSQLESVFNAPLDPDWEFETKRDQRLALEMLKKIDRRRRGKRGNG